MVSSLTPPHPKNIKKSNNLHPNPAVRTDMLRLLQLNSYLSCKHTFLYYGRNHESDISEINFSQNIFINLIDIPSCESAFGLKWKCFKATMCNYADEVSQEYSEFVNKMVEKGQLFEWI